MFSRGKDYVNAAIDMFVQNDRSNNEFYVCPTYNEAIEDGKKVKVFPIERMWGLGTPEDLDRYTNDFNSA